jgi:hypothetical protein
MDGAGSCLRPPVAPVEALVSALGSHRCLVPRSLRPVPRGPQVPPGSETSGLTDASVTWRRDSDAVSLARTIPTTAELGGRAAPTAVDRRRLERARRERDRRIAERGARILAALRQRAPGTDSVGV